MVMGWMPGSVLSFEVVTVVSVRQTARRHAAEGGRLNFIICF